MEKVVELASRLGEEIAGHARCKALKDAAVALKADAEAKQLESDYADAARALKTKADAGQPLEPEEKRREADLRNKMATNEAIRAFLRAQADFQELMSQVNGALEKSIGLE